MERKEKYIKYIMSLYSNGEKRSDQEINSLLKSLSFQDEERLENYILTMIAPSTDYFMDSAESDIREEILNKYTNPIISIFYVFRESYIFKYGNDRTEKIFKKVKSSNNLMNHIDRFSITAPTRDDIVLPIMSLPYFMFSNKPTVTLACLTLLEIWNLNYNRKLSPYFPLLEKENVEKLGDEILTYCSIL